MHIILGGFLFFLLGALLAILSDATFDINRFLIGYAIVFTAHLSVSYSNDYFDTKCDRYTTKTLFSGGSKILIEHPELRSFSKWFAISLIGLSITLTLVFILVFSSPVILLGFVISGNFLGWFYTAPPIRLAYRGLGELSCMITAGLLLPGMGYWAVKGQFDFVFALFAIPFLMYGLAFIIYVELPDMDADRRVDKMTLIVRKGQCFGFIISAVALSLASLYFLIISQLNLVLTVIDFRLITLFSLIPFGFGIRSLVKRNFNQTYAIKLVNGNLSSYFLFILLIDCYFLYIFIS